MSLKTPLNMPPAIDAPKPEAVERLLVIKLSGLGDLILSLRALQAIRHQYPQARITLLTTRPFARLCKATGFVHNVWVDSRPRIGKLHHLIEFRQRLIRTRFDLVIDLQRNDRTAMYFHMLFSHQPSWSGHARGCRYYCPYPMLRRYHVLDRDAAQLSQLGIMQLPRLSSDWLQHTSGLTQWQDEDIGTKPKVFLVPGRHTLSNYPPRLHRLLVQRDTERNSHRQWSLENFIRLARYAVLQGTSVYLLGTGTDVALNQLIKLEVPQVCDLSDRCNVLELILLSQQTKLVVGHDTGITHVLAACGSPTLILKAAVDDNQQGVAMMDNIRTLQRKSLRSIGIEEVLHYWN